MTVPAERTRAIQRTREFLFSLLDSNKTPRVPKYIREQAYNCLRHYPCGLYFEEASKKLPDIFGKPYEEKSPFSKD